MLVKTGDPGTTEVEPPLAPALRMPRVRGARDFAARRGVASASRVEDWSVWD